MNSNFFKSILMVVLCQFGLSQPVFSTDSVKLAEHTEKLRALNASVSMVKGLPLPDETKLGMHIGLLLGIVDHKDNKKFLEGDWYGFEGRILDPQALVNHVGSGFNEGYENYALVKVLAAADNELYNLVRGISIISDDDLEKYDYYHRKFTMKRTTFTQVLDLYYDAIGRAILYNERVGGDVQDAFKKKANGVYFEYLSKS